MTEKEFLNNVANASKDVLQLFLDLLDEYDISYCVIGGLAVNAYVEPVVSLDLDIVVAADKIEELTHAASRLFKVEEYEHSINLTNPESQLRIQLQTDPRYQAFIRGAEEKSVMGYRMNVAALEDVMKGKIWAYSDESRRKSKRQKDLADISRMVESHPQLEELLPDDIKQVIA